MFHNLFSPHTAWQEDFFHLLREATLLVWYTAHKEDAERCCLRHSSFCCLTNLIVVNVHRLLVCCLGRIRRDHVNYPVRMHGDNGSARMFFLQVQVHAWYIVCDCTAVWFGGSSELLGSEEGWMEFFHLFHAMCFHYSPPKKGFWLEEYDYEFLKHTQNSLRSISDCISTDLTNAVWMLKSLMQRLDLELQSPQAAPNPERKRISSLEFWMALLWMTGNPGGRTDWRWIDNIRCGGESKSAKDVNV